MHFCFQDLLLQEFNLRRFTAKLLFNYSFKINYRFIDVTSLKFILNFPLREKNDFELPTGQVNRI